jgi:hypothetical protein
MSTTKRLLTFGFAGLLLTSVAARADLVTNGGFESGFTGWTHVNETGSFPTGNWFVQSGTSSPVSGIPVPAPPGPTHAAMTDSGGPGSHALLQTFTIPTLTSSVVLTFDMFRGNRANVYFDPNSLDFNPVTIPNQQARVDILTAGAGAFDLGAAVVDNVFKTLPGSTTVDSAYLHYTFNITSAVTPGQTYQLRFAETDNQNFFQLGVDNVSIVTTSSTVPEPSAVFLPTTLFALVILSGLRRKRQP